MRILKGYRYRVYPTAEQEALFRQTVGAGLGQFRRQIAVTAV
jgi:hypothetical protein